MYLLLNLDVVYVFMTATKRENQSTIRVVLSKAKKCTDWELVYLCVQIIITLKAPSRV